MRFRAISWTAAGVALAAGGVAACGERDVIKEEPTPVATPAPAPTAPAVPPVTDDGEGGERGEGGDVGDDSSGEGGDSGNRGPG